MIKLNNSQEKAVKSAPGPILVVAGPGSGKTKVITNRTSYIIKKLGVIPQKVLVLSFTKASALEMEERFLSENKDIYGVSFATIHSAFFKIIRSELKFDTDCLISETTRNGIFKYIWEELNTKYQIKRYPGIDEISKELGKYRSNLFLEFLNKRNLNNYTLDKTYNKKIQSKFSNNDYSYNLLHPISEFLDMYSKEKNRINKIDYDDILYRCFYLLINNYEILKKMREKFDYILIDEFQDISRIQYEIIKLIAYPKNNLFVVGDDDQSIYGFRGASPNVVREFLIDFPQAKKFFLTLNYRCSVEIINHSKNLIRHNSNRIKKDIEAVKKESGKVNLILCENKKKQAEYVVNDVKKKVQCGISPSEIAILCRSNYSFKEFIGECKKNGIDFYVNEKNIKKSNNISFVEEDIISYLKLTLDKIYRKDIYNIINKPNRYIYGFNLKYEEYNVNLLIKEITSNNLFLKHNYKVLSKLMDDIVTIKNMPPFLAINYIQKVIEYERYLKEKVRKEKNFYVDEMIERLEELKEKSKNYNSIKDFLDNYIYYKKESIKSENLINKINILTMHGSKGLEYGYVYIPDLNEGIIPNKEANCEESIEEERRLLYVAMTRAKIELNMLSCKFAKEKKVNASRFLTEI